MLASLCWTALSRLLGRARIGEIESIISLPKKEIPSASGYSNHSSVRGPLLQQQIDSVRDFSTVGGKHKSHVHVATISRFHALGRDWRLGRFAIRLSLNCLKINSLWATWELRGFVDFGLGL